jgi:hypothetical protein
MTLAPLLLVSKEINAEVGRVLKLLGPQWHHIINSTIYLHRILSPSPVFLNICSRSRFVFDYNAAAALWLISHIGLTGLSVRDIVIQKNCLVAYNMMNRRSWSPIEGDTTRCAFTDFIREHLRSLDSIALAVPRNLSDLQGYCKNAPESIIALLSDKMVNTVRFLYGHTQTNEEIETEVILRRVAGPLNAYLDAVVGIDGCEKTKTCTRVFDIVEENTLSWSQLGAKRVVKITRWADTKIGSPTYIEND